MTLHNLQGTDIAILLSMDFVGSDSQLGQGLEAWGEHIRTTGDGLRVITKAELIQVKEEMHQSSLWYTPPPSPASPSPIATSTGQRSLHKSSFSYLPLTRK